MSVECVIDEIRRKRRQRLNELLAKPMVRLDIGCGAHYREPLDEWIHMDMSAGLDHVEIIGDFSYIPLGDKRIDEIYIGDIIEHIPQSDFARILCEWNRVAKIGCVIRGTTPNIESVIQKCASGEMRMRDAILNLYGWADHPGQIHYVTFTKHMLTKLFWSFGFEVTDYSESPGMTREQNSQPWWFVFRGVKTRDVNEDMRQAFSRTYDSYLIDYLVSP